MWGKEKNNMVLPPVNDVKGEEVHIIHKLENIRNSSELQRFILRIKSEVEECGINHFYSRVKKDRSAIRKYREGEYKDIKQLDDLCGIMIITESIEEIDKVAEILRGFLVEPQELDLNNGFKSRGVPPLSYIMKSNIQLDDTEIGEIPIEVRIQEKKRFFVIESLYYTLYKNDLIDKKLKWQLNEVMMKIMKIEFDIKDPKADESKKAKLERELETLLRDNEALLSSNWPIVYEAWREFARVKFEYMYTQEIDAASLFDAGILEKINDMLIKIFDEYYFTSKDSEGRETKFPAGARIEEVLKKMNSLTYLEIIQLIQQEEITRKEAPEL